jgi:hypothetical protein
VSDNADTTPTTSYDVMVRGGHIESEPRICNYRMVSEVMVRVITTRDSPKC